ncbi:MAG: DUF1501 domain-containing protein [Planctomycetaceae bacterium]|jgi:hypothetical protein|nr:DUF1501 domain-containing protein [Planctomycetaceae bacterium]MBT6487828.1 DUF1501 domain-containing protein [Planctomycetaceae bacterium]MBT6493594.1 DUF1501 domain-containing protein [Planctomycetaceae bacterium]
MLDILSPGHQTCDGIRRRDFVRVGSLGIGGLTLPNLLRQQAAAKDAGRSVSNKSVILVWLAGGPSHIDMYDLKPDAPSDIRGEFKPIATKVPGVEISEHLPLQAKIMDKLAVVRSAHHTNAGHGMGSQWMQTGWHATIEVNDNIYPSCGSVVSRMKGPNSPGVPAYVNLPRKVSFGNAAYLGASYNPFTADSDPNNDNFQVRNLQLPGRVDESRLGRRQSLLSELDTLRRDVDTKGDIKGIDKFYGDALEMVTSDKAQRAFKIQNEDPKLREQYGRNDLGQSCLLARRLVEAGVTYVSVQAGGGWDTHGNNFTSLKDNLLPKYDRAVATLVSDLAQRGLQDDVLVMTMGEFGRTPRINPGAGRDHWPGAMSILYAGGGLNMGQAVGSTNSKAEYPTSKPATPGCVLSTMYHVLGIDHRHVFYDEVRRRLPILNEGRPIQDLVG